MRDCFHIPLSIRKTISVFWSFLPIEYRCMSQCRSNDSSLSVSWAFVSLLCWIDYTCVSIVENRIQCVLQISLLIKKTKFPRGEKEILFIQMAWPKFLWNFFFIILFTQWFYHLGFRESKTVENAYSFFFSHGKWWRRCHKRFKFLKNRLSWST